MGLLDSSPIPTPGGQDVLVMVLAAAHPTEWLYWAACGVAGGLVGGTTAYLVGRIGGQALFERMVPERRRARVLGIFRRWGSTTVFVAALMPPPMPIGPLFLAAGALTFPLGRFIVSLGAARAIRYTVGAWLAAEYGRRALALVRPHGVVGTVVLSAFGLTVVLGSVLLLRWWGRRRREIA